MPICGPRTVMCGSSVIQTLRPRHKRRHADLEANRDRRRSANVPYRGSGLGGGNVSASLYYSYEYIRYCRMVMRKCYSCDGLADNPHSASLDRTRTRGYDNMQTCHQYLAQIPASAGL